jgi:serine/threonine-protein kinase RsbW
MIEQKKILLNYQLPARLEAIETLANEVKNALADYQDCVFPVNLCLDELITNTVMYGLKGACDRTIEVEIRATEHYLEIQITDDAPPFDPFLNAPHPDLTATIEDRKIGGLGIYFVEKMMNEHHAHHDGQHNVTTLRKFLNQTNQ